MGLTSEEAEIEQDETPEQLRGLPAEPEHDPSEIRSAISDAGDVATYAAKALEALKNEDYGAVKGYLNDIETASSSTLDAMTKMEEALSRYDDWGYAWKQEAISTPTGVIEHLEKDWKSCLIQVTEIQAESGLSAQLADRESEVAIRSWGITDAELVAATLAVCKIRGKALNQQSKGHQPVVSTETKIRKITGEQHRPFF